MTEESVPGGKPFGELHSITRDRFGRVGGGAMGGGFHWLLEEADRQRGFFSEPDRRLLLTENWDGKLEAATERNARLRIRNRVLTSFFDARYLRYMRDVDRQIIFENARDEGYDLHFREGFKEFVRFTYRGLLELDTDIDIQEILETAVREAEQEYALKGGENVNFQVDLDVTSVEGDSIEELEYRYSVRDELTRHELAVLVNSQHTRDGDLEEAADISLADALYYDARQPDSDPHGYSWEDPDREEAEEIVEWLRSVFDEHDIETYDDLEVGMERLSLADEELGDELKQKLERLPRAAPNFEAQLALDANLSEPDMELLHHILYNPDNIDVETALEQEARPRTAVEDWDPAEDQYLQKFIARVEADGSPTGGERGRERWNEVLELAEFNEDEWSDYMREQCIQKCAADIEDWVNESAGETESFEMGEWSEKTSHILDADSWEEYCDLLTESLADEFRVQFVGQYPDDIIDAAVREFGDMNPDLLGGPDAVVDQSDPTEADDEQE